MPACGYLYGWNLFNKKFMNSSTISINDLNKNTKNDPVAIFPILIDYKNRILRTIIFFIFAKTIIQQKSVNLL